MKEKVIKTIVTVGFIAALVIASIAHFNMTKDDTSAIMEVAQKGATVIVEYPDGNVYTFYGEDYDIADNRITVFFED